MKRVLLHILLLLSLQGFCLSMTSAQVSFNYDKITICQGDSYDLLNYQTNEVVVPVGWEIVGWKDIANTTVTPTVSPTVYTVQYREIANPTVILTHDLTVSLRPKPWINIEGNIPNMGHICDLDTLKLWKTAGANYDRIVWYCNETGHTGDGEAFKDILTSNYDYLTYQAYATNNECATVYETSFYVGVLHPNSNGYKVGVRLAGNLYFGYATSVSVDYCGSTPINLSDYLSFDHVYYNNSWIDKNRVSASAPRIIWDKPDQYTAGSPLSFATYPNSFYTNTARIEVDLHFKDCNFDRTIVSEPMTITINNYCNGQFGNFSFNCDQRTGKGTFYVSAVQHIDSIYSITFTNATTPGKYIPTLSNIYYYESGSSGGATTTGKGQAASATLDIQFDQNVPATLQYSIVIKYRRLDGVILTKNSSIKINPCKKEKILEYAIATGFRVSSLGIPLCDVSEYQCYTENNDTPTILRANYCKGEAVPLLLRVNTGAPYIVEWDNKEKLPEPTGANYSFTNGKHTYQVQDSTVIFYVKPQKSTVYTGKFNGVAFAFTINLLDYSLVVATDTLICKGQTIDLKSLERTANIYGTATWNVANTQVTPLVDTKYLIYGLSKNKCPSAYSYSRTDTVLVRVDSPLWSTVSDLTVAVGDSVDLNTALNTNAREIIWYDKDNKLVPDGKVKVTEVSAYTVKLKNACGTKVETLSIYLKNATVVLKANNDTIYRKTCGTIAGGMSFNVLANDHIACNSDSLSLRILSSTYPPTTSFVSNNRNINITYTYSGAAGPRKDSIQYEISCGVEKDTAFLYFIVQNPYPKITAVTASADSVHIETDMPNTVSSNIEFIYYSADFTIVASQTAMYSSYTFKNLNLPNGKYYVSVCQSQCCVLDSFMVNGTGASGVVAVNDTDSIKTCSASELKIAILSNDTIFCTTPSISLLTAPTLTGSTAYLVQDSLHYVFSPLRVTTTDSLQYKLDCNGKTDTAWVYIHLLKKYFERDIKDSVCQGKSYVFNGKSLSTAGIYKDTISNIIGCDSIITLELKYKQVDTIAYMQHPFGICEGDYTIFYGDTLRTAGIYYHTQSCDTVVRFELFVKTRIKIAITDRVCQGRSYVFRGKTFTQAGTYTDTIPNVIADLCDTVVTLTLNYKQNIEKEISKQICKGDTFNFEGTTLSKRGKYAHLFPASGNKCDSLVTLNLIVLEPDTSYLNINIQQGGSYSFGGQKIKTAGIYYNNLLNKFNCDSIVVLNLSVIDNDSEISISIPKVFTPNGDGVNDYFEIKNIDKYPKNHVLILNRWGNKLFEAGPYLNNWDGRAHFGVIAGDGLLPVGTYFYIVDLGNGSEVKKGNIYLNR